MAINSGMYNRPMTKEEERIMMAQSLKNNNMMMADNNTTMPESQFPADYTTVMTDADVAMLNERSRGAELIPLGADMSQFNDVKGGMQQLPMDSAAPIMTPQEQISPMGTPMTPEQIDEEIMRLQMLKNQMMMGN